MLIGVSNSLCDMDGMGNRTLYPCFSINKDRGFLGGKSNKTIGQVCS